MWNIFRFFSPFDFNIRNKKSDPRNTNSDVIFNRDSCDVAWHCCISIEKIKRIFIAISEDQSWCSCRLHSIGVDVANVIDSHSLSLYLWTPIIRGHAKFRTDPSRFCTRLLHFVMLQPQKTILVPHVAGKLCMPMCDTNHSGDVWDTNAELLLTDCKTTKSKMCFERKMITLQHYIDVWCGMVANCNNNKNETKQNI